MGRLAALRTQVIACRRCPRLVRYREAVAATPPRRFAGETYWARPVPSLGPVSARLLVVGLAPAAHGGNRTGRMFTGDAAGGSGDWVARVLHAHGFASRPVSERRRARVARCWPELHGNCEWKLRLVLYRTVSRGAARPVGQRFAF